MEKLYELHHERDFDLVVVDTPPTRNALDFLDAPRRLTRFLDHRLYRMLMAPTRGVLKAVDVGRPGVRADRDQGRRRRGVRRRHRLLPRLRGHGEGLQGAGRRRAGAARRRGARRSCSSPRPAATPSREAGFFADKLAEADIAVRALVVNRMHPRFGDGPRRGGAGAGRHARRHRPRRPLRQPGRLPARRRAGRRRTSPTSPARWRRAGGAGAVPAHRRPRPRRPRRGRRPPVPRATGPHAASEASASPRRDRQRPRADARLLDGLGDGHDAVEAGGVEQAGQRGPAAGHGDVAAGLPGPADAADERAEAGRVHERDLGQVDEQAGRSASSAERSRNWPTV